MQTRFVVDWNEAQFGRHRKGRHVKDCFDTRSEHGEAVCFGLPNHGFNEQSISPRCDEINCFYKFQFNNISDGQRRIEIEDKIENFKIFSDQLKKSTSVVAETTQDNNSWQTVSFTIDFGACGTVVDPSFSPGIFLMETEHHTLEKHV